ncbi:MAG: hypothetical protein LUD25_00365 [Coriobacteriaceae bacterium]|nr:hypothetical protein [Coriobacteriaceae bacterium]
MKQEEIERLYEAIEESGFTVAITGAGISIAAGGCSYTGMMARGGMGLRSSNPEKMYKAIYNIFLKAAFEHGPTIAHKALARLEEMGKLQGIITTNEDCIHTIAGSKNVAELEGGCQVNTCNDCGYRNFDYEIWNHGKMPRCPECGGIMLPYDIYSHISLWPPAVENAQEWTSKADLFLIIGTSGYFGSAYWGYRKPDAKIIQINPKRTGFDSIADLNIHEEADPVFEALMKLEEDA